MLLPTWAVVLIFVAALYFARSFRRLVLFVVGAALGHLWLLYRHLTANSEQRRLKRSYYESNPQWMAHKQALEADAKNAKKEGKPIGNSSVVAAPARKMSAQPAAAVSSPRSPSSAGSKAAAGTSLAAAAATAKPKGQVQSPTHVYTFDGKEFK